eukprot:717796-Hanusia_phi.AAC.2
MSRRDRVRSASDAEAAAKDDDGDVKLLDLELTSKLAGGERSPCLTLVDKVRVMGEVEATESRQVERAQMQRMDEIREELAREEEGYAYDLYFLDNKPPLADTEDQRLHKSRRGVVTLPQDIDFAVSVARRAMKNLTRGGAGGGGAFARGSAGLGTRLRLSERR